MNLNDNQGVAIKYFLDKLKVFETFYSMSILSMFGNDL